MTIENLLKREVACYLVGYGKIGRYSAVNIGYVDMHDKEQETQLNVCERLDTPIGVKELSELFASLCKELETIKDRITYVRIVASEDSEAALIEKGY